MSCCILLFWKGQHELICAFSILTRSSFWSKGTFAVVQASCLPCLPAFTKPFIPHHKSHGNILPLDAEYLHEVTALGLWTAFYFSCTALSCSQDDFRIKSCCQHHKLLSFRFSFVCEKLHFPLGLFIGILKASADEFHVRVTNTSPPWRPSPVWGGGGQKPWTEI